MNLESFHFLRPIWLLAALFVLPVLVWAWRLRRGAGSWHGVCDAKLLPHLLVPGSGRAARWPLAAFAAAWLVACVAMAGPAWERLPQPGYREPTQTLLVLSLARSMDAHDVAPSRLARARYELLDVLERIEGPVGLVIYAEEPYAVTPLTDDPDVVASFVPVLESRLMPGRGVRLDRAIDLARELLDRAGALRGRIVLLADAVGEGDAAAASRRAARAGYPVSVLGFGGDAAELAALARAGGGGYSPATPDDRDLERVLSAGSPATRFEAGSESAWQADVWRDFGAWLVLVPLLLAALSFRRGWAGALGLLLLLGMRPPEAAAAELGAWLWRRDQQAAQAFDAGRHAEAARLFEDPAWRAAAEYRAGDYQAAIETLGERSDALSQYNRGNALAQAGRLEEALAAYDRVLEQDPGHEDAAFNRELVKRALEERKQQQDKQQQTQGSGSSDASQSSGGPEPEGSSPQEPGGAQSPARSAESSEPRSRADGSGADEEEPPDSEATASAAVDAPEPEADAATQGPASAAAEPRAVTEQQQAAEQTLRRIPDDPGGLLREKLRRRYAERRYAVPIGGARR